MDQIPDKTTQRGHILGAGLSPLSCSNLYQPCKSNRLWDYWRYLPRCRVPTMSEDLSKDEVLQAIDRVVKNLLDQAGIQEPPVDAIVLAQKHLGMDVCLDSRQPQRGRAQRSAGQKQIFLRPEPTVERHQWTVAHEIS